MSAPTSPPVAPPAPAPANAAATGPAITNPRPGMAIEVPTAADRRRYRADGSANRTTDARHPSPPSCPTRYVHPVAKYFFRVSSDITKLMSLAS